MSANNKMEFSYHEKGSLNNKNLTQQTGVIVKEQVSGAAAGAIVGATAGSVIPGVGTAAGALGGWCVGAITTAGD